MTLHIVSTGSLSSSVTENSTLYRSFTRMDDNPALSPPSTSYFRERINQSDSIDEAPLRKLMAFWYRLTISGWYLCFLSEHLPFS